MYVHTRAVVAEERLGHEGGRHAMLLGDHADDVFVVEQVVGHLGQRAEAHVDLALAGGSHLVMVHLHLARRFLAAPG